MRANAGSCGGGGGGGRLSDVEASLAPRIRRIRLLSEMMDGGHLLLLRAPLFPPRICRCCRRRSQPLPLPLPLPPPKCRRFPRHPSPFPPPHPDRRVSHNVSFYLVHPHPSPHPHPSLPVVVFPKSTDRWTDPCSFLTRNLQSVGPRYRCSALPVLLSHGPAYVCRIRPLPPGCSPWTCCCCCCRQWP